LNQNDQSSFEVVISVHHYDYNLCGRGTKLAEINNLSKLFVACTCNWYLWGSPHCIDTSF